MLEKKLCFGSVVPTALTTTSTAVWNVTPCSVVDILPKLGELMKLHGGVYQEMGLYKKLSSSENIKFAFRFSCPII
jgi:hypothetical protein